MLKTVCNDRIEERGYLTYCFELNRQKQNKMQSCKDILLIDENTIDFSCNTEWNWRRCAHLMIIGTTGSGKSQLTSYIISCLVKQGVQVFSVIGGVGIEPIKCARASERYLCHLDNPEKAQYDMEDVISCSGADYQTMINLATDKYSAIGEMIEFCLQNGVVSYAQLLLFAKENRQDWFRVLCDNGTLTMVQLAERYYTNKCINNYNLHSFCL